MNDAELHQVVQEGLNWQPSIYAADIGVTVEHGIVRLVAHVANYAQKVAAENIVKRIKGVRGIAENLEIRPVAGTYTDEAIAEWVANLIDWNVRLAIAAQSRAEVTWPG